MTNIDKNPRQITRLRVEDQKKLEKIAGDSSFDRISPYRLNTTLELVSEKGVGLANSNASFWMSNDSNDILIGCNDDGELVITQGNDEHHLPYPDTQEGEREDIIDEIVTSSNLKTLFGNSLYGTGNIDLYRHQLKVKVGGSAVYFVITSSSNLKVASLQDLTTVTKATNGYFTIAMRPGETDVPVLVTYNNNVWGSSIGAITAITEDVVTTI